MRSTRWIIALCALLLAASIAAATDNTHHCTPAKDATCCAKAPCCAAHDACCTEGAKCCTKDCGSEDAKSCPMNKDHAACMHEGSCTKSCCGEHPKS